ncbi:glycoside hydrolase family 28 protein [Terriglobus roseus]|uniref:glycoside hydrolase family 28 protein n=1 Tax=Terriglobus roseus TaxID=392734 RepID=UPI001FCCE67C|nr:glycosyl hydrolase family 28 protein [Terriglobus roseus]
MTEPTVPRACTVLKAQLHAENNNLREQDEQRLDTERIQRAMDTCAKGSAVELHLDGASNAFLSGPLELRDGVTLLIDKGVTLYASRDPKVFDTVPGGCGTTGPENKPCKPLITVKDVKNAAIMGDGVIDGRGGSKLIGKTYSWWEQSRAAEPTNARYSAFRLVVANHADGLILYRIRLHNSPNFHVTVSNTDGFTAWGVHLLTPTVRGTDARNTDGIDPGSSTNITVAKSWIDNGDDNIAIKASVHHMSVLDNHFYTGHGMSMGSEARDEADILVDTLTLDHTTSGVRIKSNVQRGGLVRNVVYRNLCMRDVQVPISVSPFYNGQTTDGIDDLGMTGTFTPDYKGIRLENVLSLTPGVVQVAGLNAEHATELTLDGVEVRGIKPDSAKARFSSITYGPKGANFTFTGTAVTNSPAAPTLKTSFSCDGKFLPYQD